MLHAADFGSFLNNKEQSLPSSSFQHAWADGLKDEGAAPHLYSDHSLIHHCSLRCGWWRRHPQRDGRRHLWKDSAERTPLQWRPRHLREPGGAVHPGPEDGESRVCANVSLFLVIPVSCLHLLCCLHSLVSCIIALQSVLCTTCHSNLFNLASVDPRCTPQAAGVLLSSVWGAWRQQAS